MKERMLLIRKRYQRWSRLIGLRSISHCRHRLFVVRIALIGKNYCNECRDNTKLLKIMIILSIYIDYVHMYTPDMSPCSLSILSCLLLPLFLSPCPYPYIVFLSVC